MVTGLNRDLVFADYADENDEVEIQAFTGCYYIEKQHAIEIIKHLTEVFDIEGDL